LSWKDSYPKQLSKNELVGKELTIIADSPPTESNRKGMMNLKVFAPKEAKNYIVLLTGQDLNVIIDHPRFTFELKEGQQWAEVKPLDPV
jgi:RNase P/RNase MRP subunit p29